LLDYGRHRYAAGRKPKQGSLQKLDRNLLHSYRQCDFK